MSLFVTQVWEIWENGEFVQARLRRIGWRRFRRVDEYPGETVDGSLEGVRKTLLTMNAEPMPFLNAGERVIEVWSTNSL